MDDKVYARRGGSLYGHTAILNGGRGRRDTSVCGWDLMTRITMSRGSPSKHMLIKILTMIFLGSHLRRLEELCSEERARLAAMREEEERYDWRGVLVQEQLDSQGI
jgi:hypothetical protein